MTTTVLRAALYARVSTEKQVHSQTIDSQVQALQERIRTDGLTVDSQLWFCDDGYSGETLERPALERLRDQAAAGALDRVYIHTPDRLARKYAYVVLLLDEFRRAGVEVVFLNHPMAATPEGELLLQVQGVIAEYERAKILERGRRGRRQAARRGAVSVFSRAPYGYRYVPKGRDGSDARFEVVPEQAEVVRQVFEWFVRDRLAMNAIARRLTAAGIPSPGGKRCWHGSVLWHMLKNPAYQGRACFGRRKLTARPPRAMALWRAPSRVATSITWTSAEEQIEVPVPALVTADVFALAQEQLQENRRRSRLGARGMRHLLQGLVVCQECGHSLVYHGSGVRLKSGDRRGYYYRCTGLDSHRFGGTRICSSRAVRAERLEELVWRDVCTLLSDPSRLEQEYSRRLAQTEANGARALQPTEPLRRRLQQSIGRLIDAYQEGMLDKQEFEPRLAEARERLATVERAAQAALSQQEEREQLRLGLDQFQVFAERIRAGLDDADLATRMRVVRWLIKRIEVDRDEVRIIYKVGPLPPEHIPAPRPIDQAATGDLQDHSQRQSHDDGLCHGRQQPALLRRDLGLYL